MAFGMAVDFSRALQATQQVELPASGTHLLAQQHHKGAIGVRAALKLGQKLFVEVIVNGRIKGVSKGEPEPPCVKLERQVAEHLEFLRAGSWHPTFSLR
jgi:hypothetical protein